MYIQASRMPSVKNIGDKLVCVQKVCALENLEAHIAT